MQKIEFINVLNFKNKSLIDYANLIDGSFLYQKNILDYKSAVFLLKNPYLGIPILFSNKLKKYFYIDSKQDYLIKKKLIRKYIYCNSNKDYTPLKQYIQFGDWYSYLISPKKKYNQLITKIIKFNSNSRLKVKNLKKKYEDKKICAFQTRNIPHLGHQKIIDYLLLKYDHVVINPIIGPKKKGDVKFEILEKVFKFLIKNKYKKKVSYIPYIANMFYAGPREAIHHANIRYCLGFDNFVVGRDHAGAENCYEPDAAIKFVKKYKKYMDINIEIVKGSYFCIKCDKIIIKGQCNHINIKNISGTEFRDCLSKKIFFKYADIDLQKYVFKLREKLFVE